MRCTRKAIFLMALLGISGLFSFRSNVQAQKNVMGQLQLTPTTKVAKTSGVWIDGQYVGYLGELKGGNRLKLLPGEHALIVRQAGYFDYNRKVVIEPKQVTPVRVAMERDSRFIYPDLKTSSEVRLNIQPGRAAVFLDDYYVGTVDEYYGVEHAMLVVPGKHRFKIALPGYRTFETEVELFPRQKFELRTDLMGGSIKDADSLIRTDPPAAASSVDQTSPRAAR
ncbi:MAG TPA: hypothetical protein VK709_14535 [Candidatus Saccharimonadales bacterium]|jgi:hypothetical protein|nr:hypothetical protein [Candidatus Saccharimonadales bacterium]